ncbi:MAG: hypothetical protein AAB536_01645 [Patescibacteria group bacterium]
MDAPDLKKLIAGFLVFSALTSAITLISLNLIGTPKPAQEVLQIEGKNPLSTISDNALVEKLPDNGGQTNISASGQTDGGLSDPSNLTNNLANVFAEQMIANNRNGPQYDQNGEPTVLKLPGEDKAAEMIKQALSKTSFDFDDKVSVPVYKIANSFGPKDVSGYLEQVYAILGQVSSSTKSSLADIQNPTADDMAIPGLAIEAALAKLSSLSVPKPFVELHTTLLRFFSNQKNVFNAVADYQSDPMKTIVALQNEEEIINRDLTRVKNAAMKVDKETLSLNNDPAWEKLYSEIFGVKKAYALFGIGDIVFDPSVFAQAVATVSALISNNLARISEWLYTTALRIAVNILINEFQNQVVNWISGNGNPKFITDWRGFLRDVANKTAGQVIYNISPGLCSGFGSLIRISLLPVPYANTGVRCTLNQVVSNVQNFFNRFQTGGWYAYSYAMQPNNNYFGALITAYDRQLTEVMAARDAASNQAVASKGFLSIKKCVQTSEDELGNVTCVKEIDTTPGSVVGETLTTSLGWKGNQIVNAQRFEDLVAAIVNASINRIIREGLSSLTEAMNPATPSFTGATPTGVTNPGSLGATATNVNNLINSLSQTGVFEQNQIIIDADTQWLSLESQATTSAIALLNQLSASCTDISAQISQKISELNSLTATTQTELNNANAINNFRSAAQTATSTQEIANLLNALQSIDINRIESAATAAQDRLAALLHFISVVQSSLLNGNCNITLPSLTSPPQTNGNTGD